MRGEIAMDDGQVANQATQCPTLEDPQESLDLLKCLPVSCHSALPFFSRHDRVICKTGFRTTIALSFIFF